MASPVKNGFLLLLPPLPSSSSASSSSSSSHEGFCSPVERVGGPRGRMTLTKCYLETTTIEKLRDMGKYSGLGVLQAASLQFSSMELRTHAVRCM